jgi:hypothetical protein
LNGCLCQRQANKDYTQEENKNKGFFGYEVVNYAKNMLK